MCLLVLSPLPNPQTHLTGQWSLRYYGAIGFVRLRVVQRKQVPRATSLALLCQGYCDPAHNMPSCPCWDPQLPKMSFLGAAPCSLPIALNGTDVLQLTSVLSS